MQNINSANKHYYAWTGRHPSLFKYCNQVWYGTLRFNLIFFFTQGNSGEQLAGHCKRQKNKSVTIKMCLTV